MKNQIRPRWPITSIINVSRFSGPYSSIWEGAFFKSSVNPLIERDQFGKNMEAKEAFDLLF